MDPETMQQQSQTSDSQPMYGQQMGAQMSPEEMKSSLDEMMSKVDEKMRGVNAKKFIIDNNSEQGRIEALKSVLNQLEEAGVDLNDQQSINEFMANLEDDSPDLYELFTDAMEMLLDKSPESQQEPTSPSDLSNLPSMVQGPNVQGPSELSSLSAMMPQQ